MMNLRAMWRLVMATMGMLCIGTAAMQAQAKPAYFTATDTILILGAVPQEIPPFVAAMKDGVKKERWGIPYWQGHIEGKPVVVAITGVGKVYTAMTLTLFLTEFKPRLVLMSGTGARVNPELRTGDVIVATMLHVHDYGSLTRNDMVYRPLNSPADGAEVENAFVPQEALLKIADAAIATYQAPEVTANGATYKVKVRRGVVSSSDLFGVTQQRIDTLRTQFRTDIMEMESAALAQVCQTLGVPYLVVRAGSNVAQETPNNDYLRLGPVAAKQAALFSLYLLKML